MAWKKHKPETVKKMYLKGYTRGQIQSILKISKATFFRYLRLVGGLTEDDQIQYLIAKKERKGI